MPGMYGSSWTIIFLPTLSVTVFEGEYNSTDISIDSFTALRISSVVVPVRRRMAYHLGVVGLIASAMRRVMSLRALSSRSL